MNPIDKMISDTKETVARQEDGDFLREQVKQEAATLRKHHTAALRLIYEEALGLIEQGHDPLLIMGDVQQKTRRTFFTLEQVYGIVHQVETIQQMRDPKGVVVLTQQMLNILLTKRTESLSPRPQNLVIGIDPQRDIPGYGGGIVDADEVFGKQLAVLTGTESGDPRPEVYSAEHVLPFGSVSKLTGTVQVKVAINAIPERWYTIQQIEPYGDDTYKVTLDDSILIGFRGVDRVPVRTLQGSAAPSESELVKGLPEVLDAGGGKVNARSLAKDWLSLPWHDKVSIAMGLELIKTEDPSFDNHDLNKTVFTRAKEQDKIVHLSGAVMAAKLRQANR